MAKGSAGGSGGFDRPALKEDGGKGNDVGLLQNLSLEPMGFSTTFRPHVFVDIFQSSC
jgi:hypothetical protein